MKLKSNPLINRTIGMMLFIFAGWDACVYFYMTTNLYAVFPITFYVLAGVYLVLGK